MILFIFPLKGMIRYFSNNLFALTFTKCSLIEWVSTLARYMEKIQFQSHDDLTELKFSPEV